MSLNFFQNVQNVSPVPQFGIIDPAQNSSNPIKNAYVDYVNTCNWNTTIISNNNPNVKLGSMKMILVKSIFIESFLEDKKKSDRQHR